jgi:sugar transferase (PEP-CTERM system associated)
VIQIGGLRISRSTLLLVTADSVVVALGLTSASALRLLVSGVAPRELWNTGNVTRFILVVLVWEIALYYNELYDLAATDQYGVVLTQLLQASAVACLILAVLYYAVPQVSLGRGIAGMAVPVILLLLLSCRVLLKHAGYFLNRPRRVLVVGTGEAGISSVREILGRPGLNLRVVGFLDESGANVGKPLVNPGIIGAVNQVQEIALREKVDRVVLSLAERRGYTPLQQLLRLKLAGVCVEDAHTFYENFIGRILLDDLSRSWLILSDGFRKSRPLMAAKRCGDITLSLISLALMLPLMGIIALAIWLETGTPILFRQERVGKGGRHFEILKFRSMYEDAESNGPRWAVEGDKRVTRVGRLIRKYRLDELPQLLNVLRGEMSLVGPRPERPHFCALLEDKIPLFAERQSVRPGITGWAQIKYQYGSSAEEAKRKLEFDLYYIKNLSLFMDIAIIFQTAKVMLSGRGAK